MVLDWVIICPMKTLLVLRHAKSSWDNARLSDHERPLNGRGKADAPRMGRLLRDEELTPDLIVSSSAERALMTAEAAAIASGYEEKIAVTRALYHAGVEDCLEVLADLPGDPERVMIVGHNPTWEMLVEHLTGEIEPMPTAALAQIELPIERWADLDEDTAGKLINLWRPREL
jgi:phosphohistidine phosphatase